MVRLIRKMAVRTLALSLLCLTQVNAASLFYLTDYANSKIKAYDSDSGALVQTISGTQSGTTVLDGPTGLAIDTSGRILAASVFSLSNVNAFTPQGTFSSTLISGYTPTVIALDSAQRIYVAEISNNTISQYTSSGTFLQSFSTGINGWAAIGGIAIDSSGMIYVSNRSGAKVKRFTSNGTSLGDFATLQGEANGLAFDLSGNLLVGSASGGVYKINANGSVTATYNTSGGVGSVAVDTLGNIYAVNGNGVDKFNSSGTLLTTFAGSNYYLTQIAISPISVPEPTTAVFALVSVATLTIVARRKQRHRTKATN